MKKIIYQVYLGKRSNLYDHCTQSVVEYAKSVGADYQVLRQPILRIKPDVFMTNRSKESYEKHGGFLPIYEKENAFAYLREYDQVAIIDADVFIRSGAPSIFDELPADYSFGGVLERDMPITAQYKSKIAGYSKMQYGMAPLNKLFDWNDRGADFYNMGIMLLNKSFNDYLDGETPMQFLRRPRFKPFIDGIGAWKWSTDQTLLNVFVKESGMKVKNLDWRFNALYKGIKDEKLKDAHFIHFFLKDKLPMQGENITELMKTI